MSVLDEIQEAMRANGGGGGGIGVVFVAVDFVAAFVVAIIEIALRFLVVFPRPPFYSSQVEFMTIPPFVFRRGLFPFFFGLLFPPWHGGLDLVRRGRARLGPGRTADTGAHTARVLVRA